MYRNDSGMEKNIAGLKKIAGWNYLLKRFIFENVCEFCPRCELSLKLLNKNLVFRKAWQIPNQIFDVTVWNECKVKVNWRISTYICLKIFIPIYLKVKVLITSISIFFM